MKATLEIPDDLYRRVKARSAMEGRPLRSVAMELFQNWLDTPKPPPSTPDPAPLNRKVTRFDNASWLSITKRHLKPHMNHEMDEIRAAIAKGRGDEVAEKLDLTARTE